MSTIYLASLGKSGLQTIAELCYHKAHYAASLIDNLPGYSLALDTPFFREFVVQCPLSPEEINRHLLSYGIVGGLDVSPQIRNGMMFCCTELNSKQEIDSLAEALAKIGGGNC